jgi:hypothetical protein
MQVRIVKKGSRNRPVGCPWLIDVPHESTEKK